MNDETVYVIRPSLPPMEEYVEEIRSVWETNTLTNQGPKYWEFEGLVKDRLRVAHASLLANGHLALMIAFKALDLDEGEVITTPFTFSSTTHAIVGSGLTPVFCDINAKDWTLDVDKVESLITPRTKAIVGVHVYGNPCDMQGIEDVASRHGLKVIYDAAHAFGEEFDGRGIGSYGDISMFSFHATKVFNSVEGGCLTFDDPALYERIAALRNFGALHEEGELLGINAKMSEMHAAMGICNLRHVDEYIASRREVYEAYSEVLSDIDGISTISYDTRLKPNYAYYPVVIDESAFGASRDAVAEALAAKGIYARKYFWPLTSSFACYKGCFPIQETPVAESVSRSVICLPMFAGLPADKARDIALDVVSMRG